MSLFGLIYGLVGDVLLLYGTLRDVNYSFPIESFRLRRSLSSSSYRTHYVRSSGYIDLQSEKMPEASIMWRVLAVSYCFTKSPFPSP